MDARVSDVVTDAHRYPTLSSAGRNMLQFLKEHPAAPIFRNQSGNCLLPEEVVRVRAFEREVAEAEIPDVTKGSPEWLPDFVNRATTDVPFYRKRNQTATEFEAIPTISRAELGRDIAQFVPDDQPIDRLINFSTSGTSGHPLLIASHPVVPASYLAFHKRALRRFGIELRHGRGQVGVVLAGFQQHSFTYVSVTPTMDESGLAKINLHPNDWRKPEHRAEYLNALQPEVITGDPLSFDELLNLPLNFRPRALMST